MSTSPTQADAAARVRDEALDWFVRSQGPGFDAQQERAWQHWMAQDAAHRAAWAHWQREWSSFDQVPQAMRLLLQRNLAHDQAMAAAGPAGAERLLEAGMPPPAAVALPGSPTSPARRRVLVPALALGAGAMVAGTAGLMGWRHWQAQAVFAQAFGTRRGQQQDVTLPDGSRLRLDTATRLQVTFYRQHREVQLLDGQAVFAVEADVERPFVVLAGPLRVTVVGTRFSVRHTPGMAGDEGVRVEVEEGRVKVESRAEGSSGGQALILSAAEQVACDAGGHLSAVAHVADGGMAPWREHRIRFDSVRLDRVLAEFARYREVPWHIGDPGVAALPVSGVFDPRDLATFRRVLPLSLPVRLKEVAGGQTEVVPAR